MLCCVDRETLHHLKIMWLFQLTCGDRQNPLWSHVFLPWPPAFLKTLRGDRKPRVKMPRRCVPAWWGLASPESWGPLQWERHPAGLQLNPCSGAHAGGIFQHFSAWKHPQGQHWGNPESLAQHPRASSPYSCTIFPRILVTP